VSIYFSEAEFECPLTRIIVGDLIRRGQAKVESFPVKTGLRLRLNRFQKLSIGRMLSVNRQHEGF